MSKSGEEKRIEKSIIKFLAFHDCWLWGVNAGKIPATYKGRTRMIHLAPKGHSDIQGIHKRTGRFIAIEVKTPETRNTVTPEQQKFIDDVLEWGGIAGVATSGEEALEIIESQTGV